ncbi:autophagy-related protein 16 [Aspergillus karnatakaensis]|uniref:ATG16 family protein n=1 Tax=Aspergillus karnatakaensis TaxID=1810916 RepID=UPI003CCDFCC6
MSHWRQEYAAALAARDRREKANADIYNAYTKLADRTAAAFITADTPKTPETTQSPIRPHAVTDHRKQSSSTANSSPQELLSAARIDLAEAQRSRSDLQERLARTTTELEKLRKRNDRDSKRIISMESENSQLQVRLKDKVEEARGKAKLLEDFQDELATLNLQLNMSEEKSEKLKKENQELVDRWMARMGKEADAMNDAYKFS